MPEEAEMLVVHAYLFTMAGTGVGYVADGAVAVEGSRIVAVGSNRRAGRPLPSPRDGGRDRLRRPAGPDRRAHAYAVGHRARGGAGCGALDAEGAGPLLAPSHPGGGAGRGEAQRAGGAQGRHDDDGGLHPAHPRLGGVLRADRRARPADPHHQRAAAGRHGRLEDRRPLPVRPGRGPAPRSTRRWRLPTIGTAQPMAGSRSCSARRRPTCCPASSSSRSSAWPSARG